MKNRLLILLIAFVFAGCGDDVIGQTRHYKYVGTYTYLHKSVTWSGGQTKQTQANAAWCTNPTWTQETKYDRYQVKYSSPWYDPTDYGGYEGDKYVLQGADPEENTDAFPGTGGVGYFFKHPDAEGTISAIEITASNGVAPTSSAVRIVVDCPTDEIEIGNTVPDDVNKINEFYRYCTTEIINTMNVDIIDNRVWVVNEAYYLDGDNKYYRVKTNEWIKIDTNGFIVDTIYVNCQTTDDLICTAEYLIPVNSNSMKTVSDLLGIDLPYTTLWLMGDQIGLSPPINFPDDFRGLTSNVYAYANGSIISSSNCSINVPSIYQEMLVYLTSDIGVLRGSDFCFGQGYDIEIELVSGTETIFVVVGDCNPSYSDKGETRVDLDIIANTLPQTRQNRVIISSDAFEINFIITQKGSGQDPEVANLRTHQVESYVCGSSIMQNVWYDSNLYANPLQAPIYTNAELTNLAFPSWYSDGLDYRYWNGSSWDGELEFCP